MKKLLLLLAALCALTGVIPRPVHAVGTSTKVYAFCGIETTDGYVSEKLNTLRALGITATFGPCRPAPAGYSAAYPGTRYQSPAEYYLQTQQNAINGMGTIVYDSRLWSANSTTRALAKSYWQTFHDFGWVVAFDLGDEYCDATAHANSPTCPNQWSILEQRRALVLSQGFRIYTNNRFDTIQHYQSEFPGDLESFDAYGGVQTQQIAGSIPASRQVMCAVQVINGPGLPVIPATQPLTDLPTGRAAGCDHFLAFTGDRPYPRSVWPTDSMTNTIGGQATAFGLYFKAALNGINP